MHLSCRLGHQGRRDHGYLSPLPMWPLQPFLSSLLSSHDLRVYQAVILGGQNSSPSGQPLLSAGL